ncbi:MAG: DUF4465 domain-containing protein [Alistipes sp.]|nr:DUF4465 domain-containing protein [Alistipes sp.]
MKKNFRRMAMAVAAMAAVTFAACNADNDYFAEPRQNAANPDTRSAENPDGTLTVTFDDFDRTMMAYTPRADNYYSYYGFSKDDQITAIYDPLYTFVSYMNTVENSYGTFTEFSSGAIALSKYNYRSSAAAGESGSWWYTFDNQCSVYNTASVDGSNENAGHSGSNFAVVYGYSDNSSTEWIEQPEFYFDMPYTFKGLWYCNSSYVYGVIENGNRFGSSGGATALKDLKDSEGRNIGYFEAVVECYDIDGNLIAAKTKLLADYRYDRPTVEPVTTWTYWDIDVEGVQSVKFNFTGSDVDPDYGLNTPAYLCIDDITIE